MSELEVCRRRSGRTVLVEPWRNFLITTGIQHYKYSEIEKCRATVLNDEFHAHIIDVDADAKLVFESEEYRTLFLMRYA